MHRCHASSGLLLMLKLLRMMSVNCACAPAAGGFFGSGFKRAFKMKDFGDTIPGHGGVTDRFDCQMIMAMFAYLYYWNYVAAPAVTLGQALEVRCVMCGVWYVLYDWPGLGGCCRCKPCECTY
jgi:hypothetical protein